MKTLFLILATLLAGCASSPKQKHNYTFIELPESINKDPNKPLTAPEVQYDVDQTLFALDRAYSGKTFLPGKEYKKLIKGINSIGGPMTAHELCEKIDALMENVSDNHLNAKFGTKTCIQSTSHRTGAVGANFYKTKKDIPWKVQLEKRFNKTALLISITNFPKSSSPVWNGFLEHVKRNLPQTQLVIIDMRGNGGGDDGTGYALSKLLAGGDLRKPYQPQWNSGTPEAMQLFVNTFQYWAQQSKLEHKKVPSYITDLQKEFTEKRDKLFNGGTLPPRNQTDSPYNEFVYAKSIKKPIYLLVDADCASSCESTVDFFEYNPLAKTVGENTAGYVHFGNNGIVFLKNSGTNLQMATAYNSYNDGRFIEKTGIPPKIVVPASKNAMDYAWTDFFL